MSQTPEVAVIIPTKNRKDLLRKVIVSVRKQTVPCSLWVIDDGSTDGTPEMVRAEFPEANVHQEHVSRGPVFQRNKGARLSTGKYILTLDDDCELVSPFTVAQTISAFENEKIGAVTVPFINILKDKNVHTRAPSASGIWVCTEYYGGMIMFSRDSYQAVGGYREQFFMQGEEGDLAIRLLARGFFVRLGVAEPIHHHESPIRNRGMIDRLGPRNSILACFLNVPMPIAPFQALLTAVKNILAGITGRRLRSVLRGLCAGVALSVRCWSDRCPVSYTVFRLSRIIRRRGAMPASEIPIHMISRH